MGRSHEATIEIKTTAPQNAWGGVTSRTAHGWWLFCTLVLILKLLFLWLDSTPKLFMGDSGSYIWTALTGWIPPDRSYFYGYLVRWLAVWPHSFIPLLIIQALASAVTAIVFALICSRLFEMSNSLSFLFGLLCALDPCQLVWERYVMTETFGLLVYVLLLYWSLAYIHNRRIWQLAVVQALSVVLIGFRMSYLLVVQACTILLPVIALVPFILPAFRNQSETAINALRRRPLEIVGLGVKTYLEYCHIELLQRYARKDLGYGQLTDDQLKMLAEKFGFTTGEQLPAQPFSLSQWYFLGAWPYY